MGDTDGEVTYANCLIHLDILPWEKKKISLPEAIMRQLLLFLLFVVWQLGIINNCKQSADLLLLILFPNILLIFENAY